MDDDFWDSSGSGANLDVPAFFDSSVMERLCEVLSLGVLVSLGLTRDGGALGVAVFDDGRRRREYFRTSSDAEDWLRRAATALSGNGLGQTNGGPSRSRKPTRGA